MRPIAVRPIAIPASTRRTSGSGRAACTGDPGYSSSVATRPAQIMNVPSAQPSIRYSGQCRRNASRALMSTARLKSRIERHATIHEQADTMHVVGVVRAKPHGRVADLPSFADALVRNELHQLVVGFGRIPRLHVDGGADRAGADRVHTDTIGRHLLRDALHH